MKSPAFQFYPGDWLRDTGLQRCSLAARGLWMQLLCLMHDGVPYGHLATTQGPIVELKVMARLVGGTVGEVKRALAELEAGGVFSRTEAGGLYSRRMIRDQALRQQRAEGGRLSIGHPHTHPPRVGGRVPLGPPPASAVASASASAPETERKTLGPVDSVDNSNAVRRVDPDGPGLSPIRIGRTTTRPALAVTYPTTEAEYLASLTAYRPESRP